MNYLEYRSVAGDRWDLLAAQFYGDATRYEVIARANTHLYLTAVIPAGAQLRIPIVEPLTEAASNLPPWKR